MPDRQERALFVFADAREAVRLAGGSMARFAADGGDVTVACTRAEEPVRLDVLAGLTAGAVHDDVGPGVLAGDIYDAFDVVVVSAGDTDDTAAAAIRLAEMTSTPVFRALAPEAAAREPDRVREIDIAWQAEGKADALQALGDAGSTGAAVERFERPDPHDGEDERPGWPSRIATAVLALLVGAMFGAIGTVAHTASLQVGTLALPWGLVFALVAAGALLVGMRLVVHDRLVVGSCALGLIGTIGLLSLRSQGGSVLITPGFAGYAWLFGSAIIAALVLAWPSLPARSSARAAA